ncbi:MAG: flagellar hook-basal body complex protein FliE [Sulfurimonas sp.]|jgi:flagellar hook-basal body complex protein FliE|nr:flagellar hook-basal body complex protein FliE [Sulfurimonadaceae bacterium]
MDNIKNISSISSSELLNTKNDTKSIGGEGFSDVLKSALNDTNELAKESEELVGELATGSIKDLHQAALAINKAEISMKLMLEIRNKALNAYKDLSKTQM